MSGLSTATPSASRHLRLNSEMYSPKAANGAWDQATGEEPVLAAARPAGMSLPAVALAVLEMVDGANLLVSRGGFIGWSNALAQALIADGSLIRTNAAQRLLFVGPDNSSSFKRALEGLYGPLAPAHQHFEIERSSSAKGPANLDLVTLFAITPPQLASGEPMAVLVSIRFAGQHLAMSTEPLERLFGLTKSEACVIAGLASGSTIAAVAKQRGRRLATVRNQQHAAYAKIGVRTQAELAVRIAQLIPHLIPKPLSGPNGVD